MRYPYVVILKKNIGRPADLLSIFLCLLSAICFLLSAMGAAPYAATKTGTFPWLLSVTAYSLLAGLLVTFITRRKIGYRKIRYRYLLLLAAIGWICMTSIFWIGFLLIGMVFLENEAKRPLEIGFCAEGVVINNLFSKKFDWSAFSNVILKDGLLTLDFKNNRLLQKEVDEEEEGDAEEDEFNDYCRAMLAVSPPGGTTHGGTE